MTCLHLYPCSKHFFLSPVFPLIYHESFKQQKISCISCHLLQLSHLTLPSVSWLDCSTEKGAGLRTNALEHVFCLSACRAHMTSWFPSLLPSTSTNLPRGFRFCTGKPKNQPEKQTKTKHTEWLKF